MDFKTLLLKILMLLLELFAFLIFFEVFLVMVFSADPQKINNCISVAYVDLIFSAFYLIILYFHHCLV